MPLELQGPVSGMGDANGPSITGSRRATQETITQPW